MADDRTGFPNLAKHQARPYTTEWRQFDQHWPWVVPLRLIMYLQQIGAQYHCQPVSTESTGWYPIAFSWFDFEIDYIALIPETTRRCIRDGQFKILFYYHEGDNPSRIQNRLRELSWQHDLPDGCFIFISANTAADFYFSEHECFFQYVNREQIATTDSCEPTKDFTLLNRQHKWWRASVVADLHRDGLLDNSIWSYDTLVSAQDSPNDNPISIYTLTGLPEHIDQFMRSGPFRCDSFDRAKQNDHHWVNEDLYKRSFFHLILETHFDADQSGGTFLTEKTWKCIKYGQPFVLVGPSRSLQHLRELGYRVFDDVLDNRYDQIDDPTQRWCAIKDLVVWIKKQSIRDLWIRCGADIDWNKKLFDRRTHVAVNNLLERLQCQK